MPNADLTLDNIKEEVQVRLGVSGITVELQDPDFRKSLKAALRLYNRNRPFVGNASLAVTHAQRKYGPIDTLHPGFQGVRKVDFHTQVTEPAGPTVVDPFNPNIIDQGGTLGTGCNRGDTFGQIDQRLQYAEDANRVTSADKDWQGMWERVEEGGEWVDHYYLYVYVPPVTPMRCSYQWTGHYVMEPPSTIPAVGVLPMTSIPDGDTDWFFDYVEARAKQILARVRGKYDGITNPDGASDTVDWNQLLDEGREDEGTLTEAIKARRRPLPPTTG